jgi:tRNA A37 threonylcarbamoyladenosine biosynthesis protein TsaE
MAFNLNSITLSSEKNLPPRVVLYGTSGIGKTTFGSMAPNPIFIPTEDGAAAVSVPTFPLIRAWKNPEGTGLVDAFNVLATSDHNFQTVVLDSADWTENILKEQVAADYGLKNFDTSNGKLAYGRGARAVEEYWRNICDSFTYLRDTRNMGVIIIAHSQVKRFDDPTTEAYDRYILDLLKDSAAVLTEWADVVLFANTQTAVVEEKVGINGVKKRGVGPSERWMFTQETPAFKAKCRWAVPPKLPLSYPVLAAELEKSKAALAASRNPETIAA